MSKLNLGNKVETPASLLPHAQAYFAEAWKQWSPAELGMWVGLFLKRSTHRRDPAKKAKDLLDAQNYLNMLQAHVDFVSRQ